MSDLPPITCLCPTYGRFSRLQESLACFLAQDYAGEKRLLILNDSTTPLHVDVWALPAGVEIINTPTQPWFANLGEKRQWLLEIPQTPLVAHWDDDDLYLPWHLTRSVTALLAQNAGCVKSRGAWYLLGQKDILHCRGVHHNVFEGTMVFYREEALDLGGYPPQHSGQAKHLMDAFGKAGRLHKLPDADSDFPRRFTERAHSSQSGKLSTAECQVSYVYRWHDGVGHISSIGNRPHSLEAFQAQNRDFGQGEPLTPGDLAPYWKALSLSTEGSP